MTRAQRLKQATIIAQAIATVRKLEAANAPRGMQIHAITTLAQKVAPHTCGDRNHIDELVLLLLNISEAAEELEKSSTVPGTMSELEAFFKRLDE